MRLEYLIAVQKHFLRHGTSAKTTCCLWTPFWQVFSRRRKKMHDQKEHGQLIKQSTVFARKYKPFIDTSRTRGVHTKISQTRGEFVMCPRHDIGTFLSSGYFQMLILRTYWTFEWTFFSIAKYLYANVSHVSRRWRNWNLRFIFFRMETECWIQIDTLYLRPFSILNHGWHLSCLKTKKSIISPQRRKGIYDRPQVQRQTHIGNSEYFTTRSNNTQHTHVGVSPEKGQTLRSN
jgi:hypothetical protein